MSEDGYAVLIAKGFGEYGKGGRTEEPEEGSEDEGECVVDDAIWEPGDDVENGVCKVGKDVAYICTVEDGFEGWEEDDVYCGTVVGG